MPINQKYAQLANSASPDAKETFPAIDLSKVGDKFIGKVTYVGDFFEKDNTKFYTPPVMDSTGVELVAAKGKKTITTQKVILESPAGEKKAFYLNKDGHWSALFIALEAVEQSDIPLNWMMGIKRIESDTNAHKFEIRFVPPTA